MTYIKKESLYDLLADLEAVYPDAAKEFRWAVSEMPALDVEPVRRGKWVQFGSETGWGIAFECSACGRSEAYKSDYCPNCGAKMEVE